MMEYPFKDLLPLDEVLEQEGYYRDWTHLDPEVFYSLTQISEYVKTKGYGVDVRLLISQLAEHFGLKTAQINEIERLFNDVMNELTKDKEFHSLPEIAGARGGFDTLGERLNDTTAQLAQKVGYGVKAKLEDLSSDVIGAINGTGTFNLLSIPQDQSVVASKLTPQYNYHGTLTNTGNMNDATKAGVYLVTSPPANSPEEFKSGSGILEVSNAGGMWVKQTFYNNSDKANSYYRMYDTSGANVREWVLLTDNPNVNYLTSTHDVDDYLKNGKWITISAKNQPISGTFMMTVSTYATTLTGGNYWGTQTFTNTNTSNSVKYERSFYYHAVNGVQFSPYMRLDNTLSVAEDTKPLEGKVVVNLGDSIFGIRRGDGSVSSFIAERTGATVYNVGFGGTRASVHGSSDFMSFSLFKLANEIVKPNTDPTKWQEQNEVIARLKTVGITGMPSYFEEQLNTLKAIDFNTVDYITIAYGTNDFTGSIPIGDGIEPENTSTYKGALRYAIRLIITKYKKLNVLVCSPIYRYWMESENAFIDDSDTHLFNGVLLNDFVKAGREVSEDLKVPFLDNYNNLGINKYNKELYFPATDGTHPSVAGNEKLGNKIGIELVNAF